MADEVPGTQAQPAPVVVDPPVPALAPVVAAPQDQKPVVQAPPADSVILTKRELEAHMERAARSALEHAEKARKMADQDPKPNDNPQADAVKAFQEQLAAIKATADAAAERAEAAEKRAEEAERRAEDEKKARKRAKAASVEAQLKAEAVKAGIEDEDYALVLYARAAAAAVGAKNDKGEPAPQPPPDPAQFFASLRSNKPALFKSGKANTAPDGTAAAGAAPPAPQPAGDAAKPKTEDDVSDMDNMSFSRRTINKYGFNPNLGN